MAAYRQVDDLWSPAGWLPVHRDQLRAQRSVSSMGKPLPLPFYLCVELLFRFRWPTYVGCTDGGGAGGHWPAVRWLAMLPAAVPGQLTLQRHDSHGPCQQHAADALGQDDGRWTTTAHWLLWAGRRSLSTCSVFSFWEAHSTLTDSQKLKTVERSPVLVYILCRAVKWLISLIALITAVNFFNCASLAF